MEIGKAFSKGESDVVYLMEYNKTMFLVLNQVNYLRFKCNNTQ
jgi:hypothetical protein